MNTEEVKLPKQKQETVGIFRKRPKYDEEGNRIYYKKKKLIKNRVNRSVGGDILAIGKAGCGHHPHGLEDTTPMIEFIEKRYV